MKRYCTIQYAVCAALLLLMSAAPQAQEVVINEFLAINDVGLRDEDGDAPDWIELYNAGSNTVSLAGWYLTDDATMLTKWRLPAVSLTNGGYLVVFASGKDRTDPTGSLHTNFKLSSDGEYLGLVASDGVTVAHAYAPHYPKQVTDTSYGIGAAASNLTLLAEYAPCKATVPSAPTTLSWTQPRGYDDTAWLIGPGGVGYERGSGYGALIGVDLESRMYAANASAYARWMFVVPDPAAIVALLLNLKYDDGFVAYLNGTRIAAANAPANPQWNSVATQAHRDAEALVYESFPVPDPRTLLAAGTNLLAVHALNADSTSSDMLVLPTLTALADSVFGGAQGRYFATPTPDAANASDFLGFVKDTTFSVDRGFYTNPVTVAIRTATEDATIRYTLDGTAPTDVQGLVYTNALLIDRTTVLRAAAFKPGHRATDVDTHSYIFLDQVIHATNRPAGYPDTWTTLSGSSTPGDYEMDTRIVDSPVYGPRMKTALLSHPTVSLAMDPDDLFDPQTGIYVNSTQEGNAWERPVSAEFLNFPLDKNVHIDAGIRVYGNASRQPTRPKHNLRLVFRSEYGASKLELRAFSNSQIERFNGYMMRGQNGDSWIHPAASQRTDATFIRDQAARDTQVAMRMPTPAQDHIHLYINGIYWGFFQSIERIQNDFMTENYGGQEEDYDVIKAIARADQVGLVDGSLDAWTNMMALANAGLATESQYRAIQAYLDVDNLIDYLLINFHNGNSDWDKNNWQAGRHRTDGTGFKFFVWDSERTVLGLATDRTALNNNMMPTRIHAKLCENPEYRLRFADRVHKHFDNDGALTPTRYAQRWNARADEIRPALVAESARWGDYHRPSQPYTPDDEWETKVAALNATYFPERTEIVRAQLASRGLYPSVNPPAFSSHGTDFRGEFVLTISASDTVYYTLDGTDPREPLTSNPAGMQYTEPITLAHSVLVRARAFSGTEWSPLTEALFSETSPSPVRITEIMFHPHRPTGAETNNGAEEPGFEFIEIGNTGLSAVGLAGVSFAEGIDFDFTRSSVAVLAPGAHAIVVSDLSAFTNRYPSWQSLNIAGEFEGQLDDDGERIVLEVQAVGEVMSVTYKSTRGWPFSANGAGHSLIPLVLDDPTGNALDYGGNWRASTYRGGSPGRADPEQVQSIVLNEILAHTDIDDPDNHPGYDSNDGIELYNTQDIPVPLQHWFLSDDGDNLRKWPIPGSHTVAGRGWIAFDEITGFHTPITNGFGIDKAGEQVLLSYLPGTESDRVADAIRFKGQENGASLGRLPDGGRLWRTLTPTLGSANVAAPQDIVFSEIMYHPRPTLFHPTDNTEDEYVALHNPTSGNIPLWTEAGPWRLDGGISFVFTNNTILAAGERLVVVSFDPCSTAQLDAFREAHGLASASLRFLGPYSGRLSNSGERIALERAQLPDEFGEPLPWTIVDEVIYSDSRPWPTGADGTGRPIVRRSASQPGTDPANWKTGVHADPGSDPDRFAITMPLAGDTLLAPARTRITVETDSAVVSGPVQRVTFLVDSETCGIATNAPYTCTAHPLANNEGVHTLSATLTDSSGTYTSRQVRVIVSGVHNGPPSQVGADAAILSGWLSHTGRGEVTVFWGETPGGLVTTAWSHSNVLGEVAGSFQTPVHPLRANATYTYRCYASNQYAYAWSATNTSFRTAPPEVSVDDIVTREPDTGMVEAVFTVHLSAPSAQDVLVNYTVHDLSALSYVDYTPTNGTLVITAGALSATLPVAIHADTLDERPAEQFGVSLSDAQNARIVNASAICTIEDQDYDMSAWSHRARITFTGYGRAEPLRDFPVLLKLSGLIPGFAYSDFASPSGGDLRFTDESGTTLLPCEIEKWFTRGVSYVWVRVPEVKGTNTAIWAYWGNADETDPPAALRNSTVWTRNYIGVWHLGADERDSTTNGHNGTLSGTANAAGQIAYGQSFDGDNDYITFGDLDVFDRPQRLTASVWFSRRTDRADASNHKVDNILFAQSSSGDNDNFEVGTDGPNVEIYIDSGSGSEDAMHTADIGVQNDRWHHLVVTYEEDDPIEARIYLDGLLVSTRTEWGGIFDSSATSPLSLGIARAGSDNWGDFDGSMDEARLSAEARSSNWIWACWMNQGADHGVFTTYGSTQTIDSDETSRGTPFTWLDAHALVTNGYDDADLSDIDADGMTAWEEYRAGTDPTDSLSVFRFLSVGAHGALSWLAGTNAANHPFYIYRATNPPGSQRWLPCATRPRSQGTNFWQDPDTTTHRMRFYRISIPD